MTPDFDRTTLGIIAGKGVLPLVVARAAINAGREVFVLGIKGTSDPEIEKYNHAWVRSGAVGKTLALLKQNKCGDLVLIGPMDRPNLLNFRPDFGAFRLLPEIISLLRKGDDGLLSGIVRYFEDIHGFRILPAEEIAGGLAAPAGISSKREPSETDLEDVALAVEIVRQRGAQDLGQGAVVAQGKVLDVEDETGTDAMLKRVAELDRQGAASGILLKLPKPGQERRVDLPAIGVTTIENAAAAGLAGIVYEAAGALVADFDGIIARANALDLFVLGLPEGTGEGTSQ